MGLQAGQNGWFTRSTPKRACPAIVIFSWFESHVIPDGLAKRSTVRQSFLSKAVHQSP